MQRRTNENYRYDFAAFVIQFLVHC